MRHIRRLTYKLQYTQSNQKKVEQIYFQLSSQGMILLFVCVGARFQVKGDQKPAQKW